MVAGSIRHLADRCGEVATRGLGEPPGPRGRILLVLQRAEFPGFATVPPVRTAHPPNSPPAMLDPSHPDTNSDVWVTGCTAMMKRPYKTSDLAWPALLSFSYLYLIFSFFIFSFSCLFSVELPLVVRTPCWLLWSLHREACWLDQVQRTI